MPISARNTQCAIAHPGGLQRGHGACNAREHAVPRARGRLRRTLAHHGLIDEDTWAALRRLRESGRKLIMVTGRRLEELLELLPQPEVFDRIVAENGAIVYEPATKEIRPASEQPPPPPAFVEELARRGVERIAVGHTIVATWEPHQTPCSPRSASSGSSCR